MLLAAGTLGVLSLLHLPTAASAQLPLRDAVMASAPGVPVAVVIDFGQDAGVRPSVVTRCLHVRDGDNGADVLADLAALQALPTPSYAPSGLLCSIDGYPGGACGTSSGATYAYWSYWHGGARWTYASVGPAAFVVAPHDVEGWRWQPSGGRGPGDAAPGAPPSYAAICERAAVVPTGLPGAATDGAAPWATAAVVAAVVGLLALAAVRWRRAPR